MTKMIRDTRRNSTGLVSEALDDKLLHLFKIGLADRDELSKYKIAFKDKENNVKFQQYRSHILDIFDKLISIITKNSSVYEKVKQDVLKNYGSAKSNKMQEEKTINALKNKIDDSGIDLDTIIEVYNRGIEYCEENGMPIGKLPEQYAFERVNSFINNGEAREMDRDLMEETPKRGRGRPRTRPIKKYDVKSASGRSLAKVAAGSGPHARDAARELAARKQSKVPRRAAAKDVVAHAATKSTTPALEKMAKAVPRGAVKNELYKTVRDNKAKESKQKSVQATSQNSYNKMAAAMRNPENKQAAQNWLKQKSAEHKALQDKRTKAKAEAQKKVDASSTPEQRAPSRPPLSRKDKLLRQVASDIMYAKDHPRRRIKYSLASTIVNTDHRLGRKFRGTMLDRLKNATAKVAYSVIPDVSDEKNDKYKQKRGIKDFHKRNKTNREMEKAVSKYLKKSK